MKSAVVVYLSEIAELVCPVRRVKVLDDEPDNRMIECFVTEERLPLSPVIRRCPGPVSTRDN